MRDLILFGIMCASLHWLAARSEIARPLWSRVSGWFGRLLACAGCSGWWLALGVSALGLRPVSHGWRAILVGGVLGAILTPIFEAALLWALDRTHIDIVERSEEEKSAAHDDTTTPLDRPSL